MAPIGSQAEMKAISSAVLFYMDALPAWVADFNASRKIDDYLTTWDTYYPITQYTETGPDDSPYEKRPKGKETPIPL